MLFFLNVSLNLSLKSVNRNGFPNNLGRTFHNVSAANRIKARSPRVALGLI